MATGPSATRANARLNVYRGTSDTGITLYIRLHTGDPGAAGTANASALTTRQAVVFNAPSGGVMTLSSIPGFTMTATETITHFSGWDAPSGGNFQESGALSGGVPVISGSVLNFSALSATIPVAS